MKLENTNLSTRVELEANIFFPLNLFSTIENFTSYTFSFLEKEFKVTISTENNNTKIYGFFSDDSTSTASLISKNTKNEYEHSFFIEFINDTIAGINSLISKTNFTYKKKNSGKCYGIGTTFLLRRIEDRIIYGTIGFEMKIVDGVLYYFINRTSNITETTYTEKIENVTFEETESDPNKYTLFKFNNSEWSKTIDPEEAKNEWLSID